jgi:hypothetical protein
MCHHSLKWKTIQDLDVSGMLLFGWLPWALGETKKNFLSRNILVISWAFIMHTQKITLKKNNPKK